ncbi:MAG: hypothetical protein AB8B83_08220 [Bdellovibrionales bacterium]
MAFDDQNWDQSPGSRLSSYWQALADDNNRICLYEEASVLVKTIRIYDEYQYRPIGVRDRNTPQPSSEDITLDRHYDAKRGADIITRLHNGLRIDEDDRFLAKQLDDKIAKTDVYIGDEWAFPNISQSDFVVRTVYHLDDGNYQSSTQPIDRGSYKGAHVKSYHFDNPPPHSQFTRDVA